MRVAALFARRLVSQPRVSVRSFSAATIARRDIIQDLYLASIRSYKPPANAAAVDTSSLPSSFAQPKAPAPPALELDTSVSYAAESSSGELEEAEWPALKNEIDDAHNYPDLFDFECRADDGGVLLPKMLKPYDYHGDH